MASVSSPLHARSTCTEAPARGRCYSQTPSCGGTGRFPVMVYLLPVYTNTKKWPRFWQVIDSRWSRTLTESLSHRCFLTVTAVTSHRLLSHHLFYTFTPGASLTCVSSSVLRFSRWISHGSDEWSGWKGRSFSSWLLLVATMVMGGWQREREARWASSDRWSTEAPPTSCQNKNTIKPEWEKIFVVIVEAPTAVCFCVISKTLLWVFSAQSNQVTFDLKTKAKKWWALISQNTVPWD